LLYDQTTKLDVEYFTDINCPLSLLASVVTSKIVQSEAYQAAMLAAETNNNPE